MERVNRVDLTICTREGRPLAELTRHLGVKVGASTRIGEHVHLTYLGPVLLFSQGAPGVLRFLLSVGRDASVSAGASAAGNWLYAKLKDRRLSVEITIDRTVVEVKAGQLRHVIEEKLTVEKAREGDC